MKSGQRIKIRIIIDDRHAGIFISFMQGKLDMNDLTTRRLIPWYQRWLRDVGARMLYVCVFRRWSRIHRPSPVYHT